MINPDLQEDCGRGGDRCRAKCPDPYTVRYANLNRYVAVSLSVPNCFDFLTADSRPDLCGKPSCSWRIVSSDLGELLVNPSGLMKSISLPFSSSLNARDGGQLQVEFLHQRMTHPGCVFASDSDGSRVETIAGRVCAPATSIFQFHAPDCGAWWFGRRKCGREMIAFGNWDAGRIANEAERGSPICCCV